MTGSGLVGCGLPGSGSLGRASVWCDSHPGRQAARAFAALLWNVVFPRTNLFRLRKRSLARGIVLAICAFALSLRLGGFPDITALHSSTWQILPALIAFWGMAETTRCLDKKWSLYHAGILLLLYTDLMIVTMAVVLLIYP